MSQVSLDLSGIARGQPRIPEPIADALSALQTGVNNIENDQVAAAANIDLTKTELGTGSANSPILNNAVMLKGKDTGDTARELIGLLTGDFLTLGRLRRQGGSATAFNSPGSTAYTSDRWTIQVVSVSVNGGSSQVVTWSSAFAFTPIVVTGLQSTADEAVTVSTPTATGVTVYNHGAGARTINLLAIGPIA